MVKRLTIRIYDDTLIRKLERHLKGRTTYNAAICSLLADALEHQGRLERIEQGLAHLREMLERGAWVPGEQANDGEPEAAISGLDEMLGAFERGTR